MITRIAHVCLNVKDMERSVAYYTKIGFRPVFRFTRDEKPFGIYLEISEGNYIEIFENKNLNKPVNTGIVHFCLETGDIDGLIAELKAKDIPFTEKKLGCDNTWQIWLSDPDGNTFEVHAYTEKSAQHNGGTVEADW